MYIHVYRLAEKFQSEEQSPPVPVLVVTKDTGRELLRLVKENPRNVFVKVDQLSLHDVVERGGEGHGRVKGHRSTVEDMSVEIQCRCTCMYMYIHKYPNPPQIILALKAILRLSSFYFSKPLRLSTCIYRNVHV